MHINQKSMSCKRLAYPLVFLLYAVNLGADDTVNNKEQYEIAEINVEANATSASGVKAISTTDAFQGKTTINRKMIEATPTGNGDITSLLKTNSKIQFSNTNRQSTTLGEIDPADISINGAKHFQNNFQIDGFNMNNDIDPGEEKLNANDEWSVGGTSSQGISIDSDFIESLDVYDSDVSAKYGRFTGGVIDAKTRDPRAGFHGKLSMSHTRDSWVKYHINGEDQDEFENSSSAENQPNFTKYTTRLNLEGFLTENFGLLFGYTNTRSKIPLNSFSFKGNGGYENAKVNQRRNIDNYFLKGVWYATDRLTLTPSLMYAPQTASIHYNGALNSMQDIKSGGLTLGLTADYEADWAKISQKFNYSVLESSRDAEYEYRRTWRYSNAKNWRPYPASQVEGGRGDIKQTQKGFTYNLDFDFNEFTTLGVEHDVIWGLEFSKIDATYEIPRTFYQNNGASTSLAAGSCALGDEWCDDSGGVYQNPANANRKMQFFRSVFKYNAGKVQASQKSYALYLEDSMKFANLTLRPGFRLDGDDYMDKKTIAPRFSASYDVFGDEDTLLTFGRNRYYGRNFFAYKLKDGRESLKEWWQRDAAYANPNSWTYRRSYSNSSYFSQLDIPYDDETSFGIKQNLGSVTLGAKYVKRKGKDQIMAAYSANAGVNCPAGYAVPGPGSADCQVYTNDGWSDTRNFSITLDTSEPLKFWGTAHNISLSYNKMKKKQNNSGYTLNTDDYEDEIVYYDGLMRKSQLPVGNFYTPWSLKATFVSSIPQANLIVSNFISYRSKREALQSLSGNDRYLHNGVRIPTYQRVDLKGDYTWDMRIGYTQKLPKDVSFFVNLDINNVLNRVNSARTVSSNSSKIVYEAGRQFWLEAGVKW